MTNMFPRLSAHISRKLLKTTGIFQNLTECKFSYLAQSSVNGRLHKELTFNAYGNSKLYICLVRHESTLKTTAKEAVPNTKADVPIQETQNVTSVNNVVAGDELISEIPEPPVPSSVTEELLEAVKVHANGEPTFESIGLGGYGPFGLIQYYFEWLHYSLDMPWWAAIIFTSILVKTLTIPFAIDMQRNNANLQRVLPEMVTIQQNMTDARNSGDAEQAAVRATELQNFFKKNKVKVFPVSNLIRFGAHIPVFIALREMANTPVESLKQGGLYWFTDLTVADPYYLLPLCTTVTLFFVTNHAMKSISTTQISPTMRHLMRGVPLLSFLFSMHFPGAVLCHWATSNLITVAQNAVLNTRTVQKYLNIPEPRKHAAQHTASSMQNKSFKQAFSESWDNVKVSNKLANHARADVIQFNEAGKGPLKRTYKYNPLQRPQNTAVSAMKK